MSQHNIKPDALDAILATLSTPNWRRKILGVARAFGYQFRTIEDFTVFWRQVTAEEKQKMARTQAMPTGGQR